MLASERRTLRCTPNQVAHPCARAPVLAVADFLVPGSHGSGAGDDHGSGGAAWLRCEGDRCTRSGMLVWSRPALLERLRGADCACADHLAVLTPQAAAQPRDPVVNSEYDSLYEETVSKEELTDLERFMVRAPHGTSRATPPMFLRCRTRGWLPPPPTAPTGCWWCSRQSQHGCAASFADWDRRAVRVHDRVDQ